MCVCVCVCECASVGGGGLCVGVRVNMCVGGSMGCLGVMTIEPVMFLLSLSYGLTAPIHQALICKQGNEVCV